ncbi:MAG: LLM class flavin-dependent oxidoreductase [Deltaproteobacteria bacterium]|jgi:alkanesulfonate monooxygenase SsuD/methylene tetrahydromethanopterin reductase-like flavin-dependent oxidoreductase (luciferase family)|nr:LLM class flavin-dependent oxidoreductase [Deltaproteobacteria bacterium]
MKFALFHEIPVARPWTAGKEQQAIVNVVDQAVAGEQAGFDSMWTVEHHFLEEFSHCSNPEVLYGAVAARTSSLRIGYGVRLTPKPYNHPVRTAESVAMLDNLSNGRVEFGVGRSATAAELEGFGIDPQVTREMLSEALDHIVGCWTDDLHEFNGTHWSMPARRVLPRPVQQPHPPLWSATTSLDGHRGVGRMGVGLLSFAVGVPPEDLLPRVAAYREGLAECTQPKGRVRNERVATFTMGHCAETNEQAFEEAAESMTWYPKAGARQVATVADYARRFNEDLGSYGYTEDIKQLDEAGSLDQLDFDYIRESGAAMVGDPDRCIEIARRYKDAGCDLLLCLLNPYDIPHEQVLKSIDLLGKHVIPELSGD